MQNPPDSDKETSTADAKNRRSSRAHLITIETLIVHRYAGTPALLRKADKLAQEIIGADLREGEYLRVLSPGRYRLNFPKLRPDAGQLRCAVISDRIYRSIRHFNPTSFGLYEGQDVSPARPPKAGPHVDGQSPTSPRDDSGQEEEEMRKIASHAMKMMTNTDAVSREELIGSHLGRLLEGQIEFKLLPIWNVRTGLISAYECIPIRNGVLALKEHAAFKTLGGDPQEIKAIIDIIVYTHAAESLKQSSSDGVAPLLVCPVHASTLEPARYLSAYLASGADIPRAACKSLVFLVKNFHSPVSKIRVRQIAQYLRARSRGLIAEVPPDAGGLGIFQETGFHGIRMSATAGKPPEKRLLEAMNTFVERCELSKLESFIAGVETRSVALGALAAGCSYLSGAVIAARSGRRGRIEPFEIDGLFVQPTN